MGGIPIGNPKENECGFYATLKFEDGTGLYESELLKPGYGLTDLPLLQTLETGEYTAIIFSAVIFRQEVLVRRRIFQLVNILFHTAH